MKTKENILLIGGGGHCKACIDVIEEEGRYAIIGIIDLPEKIGQKVLGYPIIDTDNNLGKQLKQTKNVLITAGHIKSCKLRIQLYKLAKNAGANFPVIISPKAQVSKHTKIGEGTIIMHGAVVNADAKIGKNCIINNLALIEHDTLIGDNVHISTGSRINGGCKIGNRDFIGSGSVINQGIVVNDNIIIGSGSLVRKDLLETGLFAGNPLKRFK